MSYASALLHLTTSPDLRNFAMEALDRKGRCCSVCIRAVRGSMTRSMNDVVAMEAASLFMEEFVRRSVASPHMLLHGVWPKHPFDDAVERLASFFEARFSPGGSLWRIGRELEPAACSIASSCECASCGCIGRIVQGALYDASAEAIGATSRAWVNDAGEKAADFSAVEQAFLGSSCHDFDACGGIVCCLNFASFLFHQRRAVCASTPSCDAPFIWERKDYEGFVGSIDRSGAESKASASAFIFSPVQGAAIPSSCLFKDPFSLALDELVGGNPETEALMAAALGDASVRDAAAFQEAMRRLAELTLAWCGKTGREDPRAYTIRRCGEAGAVLFEKESWGEAS